MDSQPLWERQDWDTPSSFNYFHEYYLSQPAPRTLNEAYRRYWRTTKGQETDKNAPGSWRYWFRAEDKHGKAIEGALTWEERALAWDDYQAKLDRARWMRRKRRLEEREWALAQKMLDKAEQMIQFPVAKTTIQNGQTTIEPVDWGMVDITRMSEGASKLARRAAELPIDRADITTAGNALPSTPDLVQELMRAQEFLDHPAEPDEETDGPAA